MSAFYFNLPESGDARQPPCDRAAGAQAVRHVLIALIIAISGLALIAALNVRFAPEMYDPAGARRIGAALAQNKNYAVFDLNLNIREIRDHHIARLTKAPDVVILGASHWQEARADIVPEDNYYNAHVHRDYYEDMIAVAGMFDRHGRLPRKMIISIRDNLFTPVAERRDYLWLPGIAYYREFAPKLGLATHSTLATLPLQRWREQISAPMLFENVTRWYNADERPHASKARNFVALDTLLPDGSILWSREHRELFTQERARRMVAAHAHDLANRPPAIDPKGVEAIDTLISHMKGKGVTIVLAHPPFNPDFYSRMQGTRYMEGLARVKALAAQIASKHGLQIIGSFDPNDLGCTAEQYIDAEHANATCLARVFEQLTPGNSRVPGPKPAEPLTADLDFRTWLRTPRLSSPADNAALAAQMAAITESARQAQTRPAEPSPNAALAGVVAADDGMGTPSAPGPLMSGLAPQKSAVSRTQLAGNKSQAHRRAQPVMRKSPAHRTAGNRRPPELVWPGDAPSMRRAPARPMRQTVAAND